MDGWGMMGKKRMERRRMGRSTSIVLEGKVVKAVEMCVYNRFIREKIGGQREGRRRLQRDQRRERPDQTRETRGDQRQVKIQSLILYSKVLTFSQHTKQCRR